MSREIIIDRSLITGITVLYKFSVCELFDAYGEELVIVIELINEVIDEKIYV